MHSGSHYGRQFSAAREEAERYAKPFVPWNADEAQRWRKLPFPDLSWRPLCSNSWSAVPGLVFAAYRDKTHKPTRRTHNFARLRKALALCVTLRPGIGFAIIRTTKNRLYIGAFKRNW